MGFLRRLIVALESRIFSWRDVVALAADGWLCQYGLCPTERCGLPALLPSLQYVADSSGSDEISQLVLWTIVSAFGPAYSLGGRSAC